LLDENKIFKRISNLENKCHLRLKENM